MATQLKMLNFRISSSFRLNLKSFIVLLANVFLRPLVFSGLEFRIETKRFRCKRGCDPFYFVQVPITSNRNLPMIKCYLTKRTTFHAVIAGNLLYPAKF